MQATSKTNATDTRKANSKSSKRNRRVSFHPGHRDPLTSGSDDSDHEAITMTPTEIANAILKTSRLTSKAQRNYYRKSLSS